MSSNFTDPIIIELRTDIKNLKSGLSSVQQELAKFEGKLESANASSQKLDAGLKAFSWTTFSQGALNTSTAIAQLYTSISNIAKIQYTLKAAMIGVERAEDLVARKTLQLTKEMEKNGTHTRTAILLRNELATATEDLVVKNERVAIAQDAVNDTYILFTSNVVNTVFGTMQTLVGLKAMLVTKSLAVKAAQAQETAALNANNPVLATNTQLYTANNTQKGIAVNLNQKLALGLGPLTTTLAAQNAAMTASNIGMGTLSTGMGTATKATGLLSSALGKAGLVGSIAATGIAIGAYVFDQIQANDKTNEVTESVDKLIKKYKELGKTITDPGYAISQNPIIGSVQTQINEYESDLKKFLAERERLEKRLAEKRGSSFTPRTEIIGLEGELVKINNTIAEIEKRSGEANNEIKALESEFIAIGQILTGTKSDFDGISIKGVDAFNGIKSSVVSMVKELDNLTPGLDDAIELTSKFKEEWMEALNLTAAEADEIEKAVIAEFKLKDAVHETNNQRKMGWEQEKKYLKEIADLKKKQDPIYQKRSLFSGILGLEEDFLEGKFGKEIASHLGYQPFMGVISKRNNEVKMITDLIRLDNQLYGYTNMLEELMVILPGVSDPAQRKQITDTIIALRDNISKVKSEAGPSISSSNKTIAGFARQYTQAIGQLQNNLRSLVSHGFGSFPTFGGQDRLSQYYTNQMRSITGGAGALARSMVERTVVNRNTILASIRGVNTSRIGSVQRTTVSVPGYGDLSVKKRGGKGAYRTRQIGINMANQEYSYQLQQLTGYSLSELQSLTGLEIQHVDPNAVLWNALGSGRSNRNQFVTPQMAQQRSDYVRNYMERLERNRAEVSSRISLITELTSINPYLSLSLGQGSTELSSILKEQENLLQLVGLSKTQAKEIVVTPTRGRTEIDDRIRWTQRLEQISTGATVF